MVTAVSLDGLHPVLMRPRVEALLADPDAIALGIFVVSAFRSVALQQRLFDAAVKKYGSPAAARKWVALPGTSNHGPKVDGYGVAVDLGVPGVSAELGQWPDHVEHAVNVVASRHGLRSPMDWEDWHFEPIPDWAPLAASTAPLLMEEDMSVAKDDADAARLFIRKTYLELLLHEPTSAADVDWWVGELRKNGADAVYAQLADSPEGQAVRAARRRAIGLPE